MKTKESNANEFYKKFSENPSKEKKQNIQREYKKDLEVQMALNNMKDQILSNNRKSILDKKGFPTIQEGSILCRKGNVK